MCNSKIDKLWSAYEKVSTHFEQKANEGHELAEIQAFNAIATGAQIVQAEKLKRIADALERAYPTREQKIANDQRAALKQNHIHLEDLND